MSIGDRHGIGGGFAGGLLLNVLDELLRSSDEPRLALCGCGVARLRRDLIVRKGQGFT